MESQEAHRAAEQHYRAVAHLSQLNRDAERMAARRAATRMVEAARWRLVLGRSLIRLGTRLAAGADSTTSGRLAR
jgi:hypothetical protein